MTELYHPSTGETAEPEADPTPDAGDHGDVSAQATLAGEDQLPTRHDARAATWGEDPEYDDENDPDAEYDGDLDALTTEEDQLPTRQDARAATWGEDPEYDAEYDGDLDALTVDDQVLDLDHPAADQAAPDTGERITGLEAENAEQAKRISDLQARLERLEQGNQERPAAGIPDRARDVDNLPGETTEREHGRRLPSDAQLTLGGTVAGMALTTAAEYMSTGPAHMMEYLGGALSVGISAIAVWRENRKKDDHRPEN
jgi:hypothetical protein